MGYLLSHVVDKVFKALADPSRRGLLDRLFADNGLTLVELCEGMKMSRQAVMKHLSILEEANLVVSVRVGREKLHYLNPIPIGEIYERWIGKYEQQRLRALHQLKEGLEPHSPPLPRGEGQHLPPLPQGEGCGEGSSRKSTPNE